MVLTLSLIATRALIVETLREPFGASSVAVSAPGGPSAGTSVVLNLLCCLPAALVLVHRFVSDGKVAASKTVAPLAFLVIGAWAGISVAWASDKFAAAVGASHLVAAAALCWTLVQLTRDWRRARLVTGICFGLLLAYTARGVIYRYIELPDLQKTFAEHKDEFLKQRGWEPGSFMAEQFSKKITNAEMIGFSASPNTYAATIVLLSLVTLGVFAHRISNRDEPLWAIGLVLPLPVAMLILWLTHSRTAVAGLFIGVIALAVAKWAAPILARRRRAAYFAFIALGVFGAAALIGHGIYHGNLFAGHFGDSLNFRWRYWTSAFEMHKQHPLLGVGWNNFGDAYLAVRQLNAPEEIKDPHNFLVRALTELGIIGLVMFLVWLLRVVWELVRHLPQDETQDDSMVTDVADTSLPAVQTLAAIAIVTLLLMFLTGLDWTQEASYNFIEGCKLTLYAALILGGGVIATLRASTMQMIDSRPAPWVSWGLCVATGVFLLHSLLDVALFEVGSLLIVTMAIGAGIGLRAPRKAPSSPITFAELCVVGLALLSAAFAFVFPIARAQRFAQDTDTAMQTNRFSAAATSAQMSLETVPYNSDYAFRFTNAMAGAHASIDDVRSMIDRTIAMDPESATYPLWKARFELQATNLPDRVRSEVGFERALTLNPNDVGVRLEFADALAKPLQKPEQALKQYREALRYNDALNPDEPKRLRPEELAAVHEKIAVLEAQIPQTR